MDITTVALKLENDFPRRIEIYESKQRTLQIKNETKPVLDIDCYLISRVSETCYKNFILPIKIDMDKLVVLYSDYEKACSEILEYLE